MASSLLHVDIVDHSAVYIRGPRSLQQCSGSQQLQCWCLARIPKCLMPVLPLLHVSAQQAPHHSSVVDLVF
jgi:hypothetical protein